MPAKLALAALIALAGSALAAEPYPDHPITLIVPYAAGGSSDVLARLLNEPLSKSLGQPIIIENRPGANGYLAWNYVASADPEDTVGRLRVATDLRAAGLRVRADLIVLDRNPLTVAAEEIAKTTVIETLVGGRVVYTRANVR